MTVQVKICGLSSAETIDAAVDAGADMVGFNFFARSPRYVAPDTVGDLARHVPAAVVKVGLFVEPDDDMLEAVLAVAPLDMLQLHGHETPERAIEIRDRFGLPIMKVIGIGEVADLATADGFAGAADRLLLDTKPPKDADRPGGNAIAFDWAILQDWTPPLPWMLAGGLTPGNVVDAIRVSGAAAVDVASGVESTPGNKDIDAIHAFIAAAKGA